MPVEDTTLYYFMLCAVGPNVHGNESTFFSNCAHNFFGATAQTRFLKVKSLSIQVYTIKNGLIFWL
jgi:hypothetical protein